MKAKNRDDAWNKQYKFDRPCAWVQWKGTDVCMDISCDCGESWHLDSIGAYYVKCSACGKIFFCNGHIQLIEIENTEDFHECDSIELIE
jgi:hypothetical protein